MTKCNNPAEFPMNPKCASAFITTAFEKDTSAAALASANFFNEVAAAQKNFIEALQKILPDSEWQKFTEKLS
jgi:hypothetical protein